MAQPKNNLEKILLWSIGTTTLIITPWFSYDPFNAPRLLILVATASILFFMVAPNFKEFFKSSGRGIFVLLMFFIIQMVLVLIFAPGNKWQQFFGAGGRQTGFLTYLSFVILVIVCISVTTDFFIRQFVRMSLIVGAVSIFYGLIQATGLDPFDWTNPYSPVFGFFGNPNFQAGFVGLNTAAVSSFLFGNKIKTSLKLLLLVYIFLGLFVILKTKSQQGFLVFGSTFLMIIVLLSFKSNRLYRFRFPVSAAIFIGFAAAALDILQKSPWSPFLYKPSVSYRGDFWRAGINMSWEHPFFGVGLDSYRDWFFRSRDEIASKRPNPENYIDSAHNVFIDFAANGGFPLLGIYSVLILVTARSALRVIKQMEGFNPYFIAVFATWLGYQIQSIISINQIGLAIWGWVTSGIIIGYDLKSRENFTNKKPINTKVKQSNQANYQPSSLKIGAGLIIGLSLGAPVFIADAHFRASVDSNNIDQITATANKWPKDVIRMNFISRLFAINNLPDKALDIAKDATEYSPETFESWRLIYEIKSSTEGEKAEALMKMKELDVNFPKSN